MGTAGPYPDPTRFHRTMPRRLLLAVLLGFAHAALAQPTTIDGDVVYGLLGLESPDRIQVGRVTGDLAPFLPDGAVPLATYSVSGEGSLAGDFVIGVARLDVSVTEAAADYAEAGPDGWTPTPEPYEFRRKTESGFVAGGSPPGREREFSYTRDRDGSRTAVAVTFLSRPAGGSYVRVTRRVVDLSGTPLGRARQFHPTLEGVLPALGPPPGAYQRPRGGGGGSDDYDSTADLTTDLSVTDVAAHYRDQMAAAGWDPAGESSTDGFATSSWTSRRDDRPVVAVLLVHQAEPGRYRLKAQVTAVGD